MPKKLEYKFECGCVHETPLRLRNNKDSYIRVCPTHLKPAIAKICICSRENCNNVVERKMIASATRTVCESCAKLTKLKRTQGEQKLNYNGYTTEDEIAFIKTLPPFKLQKYFTAALHRERWGRLNREKILNACKKLLKKVK